MGKTFFSRCKGTTLIANPSSCHHSLNKESAKQQKLLAVNLVSASGNSKAGFVSRKDKLCKLVVTEVVVRVIA